MFIIYVHHWLLSYMFIISDMFINKHITIDNKTILFYSCLILMSDFDDIYNNSDDDIDYNVGKSEFVNSIEEYYKSIEKYKDEHKNELDIYWKPSYDTIKEKFEEIINTISFNWLSAKKMVEELPCYKYENFSQYVYNIDLKNTKHIKGTIVRPKTLRRKRSNICPKCKHECKVTKEMDALKCQFCGYEIMKDKAGIPDNMINGEKHIRKHLDKLIGLSKIPGNLNKLLPYLTIWLTDWKYILEWLSYSKRYDNFVSRFITRSGKNISYIDFDKTIPRTAENKMEFSIYELFSEEFYKMTELVSKTAKKITNMSGNKDFIIEVIDAYMKTNNIKKFRCFMDLPEDNTTFIYKGVEYSIGIYLNKLTLTINYDENHIKNDIVKQFCYNGIDCLLYPGLMFNYFDIFKLSEDIPKSFMYSENYSKIMNEIFHSNFIQISNSDVNKLVDILLKFNDYYKKNVQKVGKKKNTKTNSPLFVCVFKCIITSFKYFNKYVNVLEQMPHRITESVTKNEIDCLWLQFLSLPENKELLELYDNNYETKDESKDSLITLTLVEDKETKEEKQKDIKHSKSKICLDDDLNDIL